MLQVENWSGWSDKATNFEAKRDIVSRLVHGHRMTDPEVTIAIITYRRPGTLRRALDSALAQDFTGRLEILVVDDSGSDQADWQETDDLLRDYCERFDNIAYYRHDRNLGQYDNWNRACELCASPYYGMLHDDGWLQPNYVSTLMRATDQYNSSHKKQLGIVGSWYRTAMETPGEVRKEGLLQKLISLFLRLRRGRLIGLSMSDHVNYIFPASPGMFINRKCMLDIGGLDDHYFPSADFVVCAKMTRYHATGFLPVALSVNGVEGDAESLKQEVCDDSIRAGYHLSDAIAADMGAGERRRRRIASRAAVFAEIGVRGYNNVDYSGVKRGLKMSNLYNNKAVIGVLNLYSKARWGVLLLRK
ncbi:MAG: glycosyltransferase [Propionibacteriaceae bacterium]|jgi:glycosyltransferase involved in cell wall biosynthesis|nr:glycosyltransferase [Propionibacteriaceae bacterium]